MSEKICRRPLTRQAVTAYLLVVDNQVDRFLRDLVTVFDANKDDEKKKFRDLMGRYEDKYMSRLPA